MKITDRFTRRRGSHHERTLKRKKREHNLSALGAVLFVVLLSLFLLIGVLLARFESERYKQQELENVQRRLYVIRTSLKNRIYSNVYKVSAVKTLVAMKPDLTQDDFARAMAVQFSGEEDLRNIGLARDMVIQFMYPIEGNEAALGLDYTTLPDQFEAVDLARRLNKIVLAGPLALVQGGEGLIARIPIHIKDPASNQEVFWGFASVVMNSEAIFAGAGITEEHDALRIAIRGRDARGAEGDVFWGDPSVFEKNPVTQIIELPYGSWQIGAIPSAGWSSYSALSTPLMRAYLFAVFIILAFTALMVFLLDKMAKTENERLGLSRSFELILKQTSDFIYYKDINSRFVFCSQTLADITNHKHWKEMVGKHDFEVFPHDIATIYNEEEEPVFKEGKPILNKVNPYFSVDGKIGYVQTNKWPIFDDDNTVSGIFGISRDITEQKKAVEALERERNLFAEGPVFTMEWGPEPYDNLPLRSFSSNVEKIIGYSPEEMLHPNFSYSELIHPDDLDGLVNKLKKDVENNVDSFEQSYRLKTKDGRYIWIYDFNILIRDEEGDLTAIRSYMYDQSAQKKAEEALRIAEERLEKTAYDLTENIPVGTYTMVQPAHGGMANFAFMSSRFLALTGLTREEAASDPLKGFACVHPDDFDEWVALNAKTFEEKKPFFGETRVVVDGEVRWVTAESIPRILPDGSTVWEGVLADITDRKQAEAILHETNAALEKEVAERRIVEAELKIKTDMLEKLSMQDGLTDIPNRRYFDERANLEWRRAMRSGFPLSLVMMDIDHFKLYNDHYGHGAGDDCLRQVALALTKSCIRPSDLVARYGGEEFVALLPETDTEGALYLAEKMRAAVEDLSTPHDFSSVAKVVTLSVGVATHGSESIKSDLQHLQKCADQALYRAKGQGRNRVQGEVAEAVKE